VNFPPLCVHRQQGGLPACPPHRLPGNTRRHLPAKWPSAQSGTAAPAVTRPAGALASRSEDLTHEAVRALSAVRPPLKDALALLHKLTDEPTFRGRWEVLRFFRDHLEPLAAEHVAWLRRWTPGLSAVIANTGHRQQSSSFGVAHRSRMWRHKSHPAASRTCCSS
jgi:hypothetical protein